MLRYSEKTFGKVLLNYFVSFICILSSVLIWFFQNYHGYELLYTQPLLYLIVFIFVYSTIIFEDNTRLFFIILSGVSAIRYVLLPLLISFTEYYGGRSIVEPSSDSFFKAILLMNYELLITALFIKIMEVRRNSKINTTDSNIKNQTFKLDHHHIGYIFFILFTLIGITFFPSVLSFINIIVPSSLSNNVEPSFIQNFILYCIIVSKQLIFIMLLKRMYKKYKLKKNRIYISISFIISLVNIFIYFGTNRSDIIISAIVSFLLLYKLFGKIVKKYIIVGLVILFFLVAIVSGARNYISISNGSNSIIDITDTFQVYTGGVYNVAIAIETKDYFPSSNDLSVLFFDIFRPMIGVNLLVKNLPFSYSNIFYNKRMWLNVDRRSQIIPMIGQGNLFFGFFLAPLFGMLLIRIYYYFEKILNNTNNLEIYYFLTLVVVRFGFFMGQNTMNIINDMSMNLVLFIMVYQINFTLHKILGKKSYQIKYR
ncbi:hypothetical protein SAMN04488102_10365 [Alkalibacterium subtropicum]|uniref:Oligosaccharide repeat unit polymerase n=1 Tax=Alkalibacterium subtropicum TaxID=753702 RepID=A0A1I1GGS3_9LACT|nr:O-antigen polymerase [Alkalibacterium subtropicum]SFC10626.1 hypothetical protein SAMN04488102_10365 [Alkalibacterium subtropicum]